mmetsp:Transcript_63470/g.138232  ORF Transcript_63470/g.138232 Transcript_63470/m.138232 type:complete len:237 (+) Transcript_63470:438-1148(+)
MPRGSSSSTSEHKVRRKPVAATPSSDVTAVPANKAARRRSPSKAGVRSSSLAEQRPSRASNKPASDRPETAAARVRAAAAEPLMASGPLLDATPAAQSSSTSTPPRLRSCPASQTARASEAAASASAPAMPLSERSFATAAWRSFSSGTMPAAAVDLQTWHSPSKPSCLSNASGLSRATSSCKAVASSTCNANVARGSCVNFSARSATVAVDALRETETPKGPQAAASAAVASFPT